MPVLVKNNLNAPAFPVPGEINNGKSETVPDMSMSIREIMDRYQRGLPLGGAKVPIYDPEDEFPDINTLDYADREALQELHKAEIDQIKSNWQKRADAIKKKKEAPKEPKKPEKKDSQSAPEPE